MCVVMTLKYKPARLWERGLIFSYQLLVIFDECSGGMVASSWSLKIKATRLCSIL